MQKSGRAKTSRREEKIKLCDSFRLSRKRIFGVGQLILLFLLLHVKKGF